MATIAQVARERKKALAEILRKSYLLDARQEALEREVKRIANRKRSVPETDDMQRIIGLADIVASALNDVVSACRAAAAAFK